MSLQATNADSGARRAPTSSRTSVLVAVLLCINVPAVVAAIEGASFCARHRSSGFITVDGVRRGYVLRVPATLDRSRPVPLVISLHGAGLWGGAQRDISGWNEVADREGFLVAYPSGRGRASPRVWPAIAGPGLLRDVEFLTRLVDTLVVRYDADPDRVYVNGLSNGGGMTFALSCAAPHRVAAAGIVGGALLLPWEGCAATSTPLPVIVFHGTEDTAAPYHGGESWVTTLPFPDIPAWVATWAARNGCAASPRDTPNVTRRSYAPCAEGGDVVLYTLHGDGHVWPGGPDVLSRWLVGTDSRTVHATEVMWEFFRERRRRGG